MDSFTRNKWTSWLVILLIVVNVVSVAALWKQQQDFQQVMEQRNDFKRGPGKQTLDIPEQLGFSKEQKEEYKQLVLDRDLRREAMRGRHQSVNDSLRSSFTQGNTSQAEMLHLSASLSELDHQLRNIGIDHYFDIRSICTPEQLEKLPEVLKNSRPQGPPPPRHNGGGPPRGGGPPSGGGPPGGGPR